MMRKFFGFLIFVVVIVVGCSSDSKSLSIKPSTANFGDVYLGDSKDIELVFKNKYGKEITITDLILEGSSDFTIGSVVTTPFDMQDGSEFNLTITFTPQTDGTIEGLLKIKHSGSTSEKKLKLIGKGVPVARISLSDTSYDFLNVYQGKTKNHDFEIENVGTDTLIIDSLNITGLHSTLFTFVSGSNLPINIVPNQKHTLTVQFAPNVKGTFSADLELHHNAVNENENLSISLNGNGTDIDAQILLSKNSPWDFGLVATTLPSIQYVEIDNSGTDKLTLTSASLTNNSVFTIDSLVDSYGVDVNFPYDVPVSSYALLKIKFAPTSKIVFNDTLTIVHNGHNEVSPYDISLSGEGRDLITKSFNYTGSPDNWVVPNGITSIIVECSGSEGGNGYNYSSGHVPGKGGLAKATVPVTPGSTVYVYVGGKGGNAASATPGTGGYNGGATGASLSSYAGGGGGGGSDIRIGGNALTDRKVVGGGGGGAAFNYSTGDNGGNGGGLSGQHGAGNNNYSDPHAGGGGTQTSGGTYGDYSPNYGVADPGTFGAGGKGGNGSGGGGGGGYYGGGGGVWAGGGGGSSYYDANNNTDTSTQEGVNSGDGEITIKY